MKKSLSALKEKFGKFEISKEQTKKVKGGLSCGVQGSGGHIRWTRDIPPSNALAYCESTPGCIGCF